jgi:phytoene synthase
MKKNMEQVLHSESVSNPLISTYEQCKSYTRNYAKSFYFSSFLLPKEKRNAAYAVYTFCRYADNIVDSAKHPDETKIEGALSRLREFLDVVYSGGEFTGENFSAFADTIRKYNIPKHYFEELIDGVCMDTSKQRYNTFAELENYCYKVASVVGLIMTQIFGYSHKAALPYAIYLGKAMQLTNILRDVQEDYTMNRVYIPQEELANFEYTEDDIKAGAVNENFIMMMRFNIERARAYYELASHGFPYLTNDGSRTTVVLMYKIYSGILAEIEKSNYDIYSGRRFVSTSNKLKMTAQFLLNPYERRKYSRMPDAKHHERVKAMYPNLNFDE